MERAEFVHPDNATIFTEVEDLIFTPETAKDWQYLYHPSGRATNFVATHKITDSELRVTFFPNHPRNLEFLPFPDFKLPAFMILRTGSSGEHLPTRYGPLPSMIIDSAGREFMIEIEYWVNCRGQGAKQEIIEQFIDELETEEEKQRDIEEGSVERVDFSIDEDVKTEPLNDEDRSYIQGLLNQCKADNFNEGAYMQNSGIS